jgi:hypothetical protein
MSTLLAKWFRRQTGSTASIASYGVSADGIGQRRLQDREAVY